MERSGGGVSHPRSALNAPQTVVLAADEASLYLQATQRRVWAKKGQTSVVEVAANRDNPHVYGALTLATGQEHDFHAMSTTFN